MLVVRIVFLSLSCALTLAMVACAGQGAGLRRVLTWFIINGGVYIVHVRASLLIGAQGWQHPAPAPAAFVQIPQREPGRSRRTATVFCPVCRKARFGRSLWEHQPRCLDPTDSTKTGLYSSPSSMSMKPFDGCIV